MTSEILIRHPWLWLLVWQSTLCLAAGLAGSFFLRRRAARAHQALLLGLIAAMVIPAVSQVVKRNQWGLFVAEQTVSQSLPTQLHERAALPLPDPQMASEQADTPQRVEPGMIPPSPVVRFQWTRAILLVWALVSSILLLRLAIQFLLGWRLARLSRVVEASHIQDMLSQARTNLGIQTDVAIRGGGHIRSPIIWCWSRRPILLIPDGTGQSLDHLDWLGIICHELAHRVRRDHISGLLGELMVCGLPWQPLVWWVCRRLAALSEEACDDWVITSGQRASGYARTLLDLTPQAQAALIPGIVTSRRGLSARIHRILEDGCGNPRLGKRWQIASVGVALCVALGLAFAQTRDRNNDPMTLETLRQQVAHNEALIDPIKLSYTMRATHTSELPQPSGGRQAGRAYSHVVVTWAQRGDREYIEDRVFYGPNEPGNVTKRVLGPKMRTYATLLPQVHVEMGDVYQSQDWYFALTAKLRLRPFEDRRKLSEILVPPHATLQRTTEVVGGRSTHVVDVFRPDLPSESFTRLWIDSESHIPLKVCIYDRHPSDPQTRLALDVSDVAPYRLPNGGWIPIAGVRTLYFPDDAAGEHVTVDVNSITTRSHDIPESLFHIDLPKGTRVYNASSHLTTVVGESPKSYEQIVQEENKYISGVVTDSDGKPIPGVAVRVLGVMQQVDGRTTMKSLSSSEPASAVTNAQGRFALASQEEGHYYLSFFSSDFTEQSVRDVPQSKHDLAVTLERGGSVTGRVFFAAGGRRTPLAGAEVMAQADVTDGRTAPSGREGRMGSRARTDGQGRFTIKCLSVQARDRSVAASEPARYVPLQWTVRCGATSQNVTFEKNGEQREVELVLRPDVRAAPPLIGNPMPSLDGLGLKVRAEDLKDSRVLVCFFDMEQRPARNCVLELGRRAASLKAKGVSILAVQDQGVDPNTFDAWMRQSAIPFPVGIITADANEVKFAWSVCSVPWLVLTDEKHIVSAEGFSIDELDSKLGVEKPAEVHVRQLRYADAGDVARAINRLFGQTGQLSGRGGMGVVVGGTLSASASQVVAAADSRTNSIVVSGPKAVLDAVMKVAENRDQQFPDDRNGVDVKTFHLQYADATSTAALINAVFGKSPTFRQSDSSTGTTSDGRVIASDDTRTNSVVVSSLPDMMAIVAYTIKELDQNSEQEGRPFVYSPKNATESNLVTVLNDLFTQLGSFNHATLRESSRSERETSGVADVKAYHLQYADARNAATLINEVFGTRQSTSSHSSSRSGSTNTGGTSDVTVVASADTWSNSIVVSGPPETLKIINDVVNIMDQNKELDQNIERERRIFVYPLKNATASDLVTVLNKLFTQMRSLNSQGTRTTQSNAGGGASSGSSEPNAANDRSGETYFQADTATNSLLVLTSTKNYPFVKPIIDDLDSKTGEALATEQAPSSPERETPTRTNEPAVEPPSR